eukprot:symbB.v1.2.002069.t1/scaffold111.1/size324890/3
MAPAPEMTRPRWADVEDNSDDEDQALRLALDDASYREAPLSSLEDSKSGLNAELANSGVGPQDFSFLLGEVEVPPPVATPFGARRLDLPRRNSKANRNRTNAVSNTQASSGPSSPRKGGEGAKKRRPTLPQAFPQKSNKSELREAALCCGFLASSKCSETGSSVQSEGIEATEEEWEHRELMRAKAVAQCKASPEYQRCQRLLRTADSTDSTHLEPATPNAADRSISKRQWKFLIQRWRYEIQRYLDEHEV